MQKCISMCCMGSTQGRMATCYLGNQYREAMDQALVECGWLHSHYVKVAILEKLNREGKVSDAMLEAEVTKIEYRKTNPHGNSKKAKEGSVRTNEEAPSGAQAIAHVGAHGRKLTPRERRARKLKTR